MWTKFWDMHSGGGQKLDWSEIFIEAPLEEAVSVFYSKFGRNPNRVTCTCCGEDYLISEYDTLKEATAFARGCFHLAYKRGKNGGVLNPPGNKWYYEEGESPPEGWEFNPRIYDNYMTLEEFSKRDDIKIVYASEISEEEKNLEVSREGYVWI